MNFSSPPSSHPPSFFSNSSEVMVRVRGFGLPGHFFSPPAIEGGPLSAGRSNRGRGAGEAQRRGRHRSGGGGRRIELGSGRGAHDGDSARDDSGGGRGLEADQRGAGRSSAGP